jgi:hypothetical protein
VLVTKDSSFAFGFLGAHLHHYDGLLPGRTRLVDLCHRYDRHALRNTIGELLGNGASALARCPAVHWPLVYGLIVVQAIVVHYQQIFSPCAFVVQWTSNFVAHVVQLTAATSDAQHLKALVALAFPCQSAVCRALLDELFGQLKPNGNVVVLNNCRFQVPQQANELNAGWFVSTHAELTFRFDDFPSRSIDDEQQFRQAADTLSQLWRDQTPVNAQHRSRIDARVSLVHGRVLLLNERLPRRLYCPSSIELHGDLLNIGLYQVRWTSDDDDDDDEPLPCLCCRRSSRSTN